jgi:Ner family transcriptional regulator
MTNDPAPKDWHNADIKAALEKKGINLAYLSRQNGLHPITISKALQFSYPKGERVIAEALGLRPEEIWPSRFAIRSARKSRIQCNPGKVKPATFKVDVCLDGEAK